jgi:IS605 OrfB family transposase
VFEQPDAVFAPFSDKQVAQSLWYHFASEASGNLYVLLDARVLWPKQNGALIPSRLTVKRTRRINHYLHTASKTIIALLVEEGIGTLVVGKNPGWKQEVELGRVNNQYFVQIPHDRFIDMLEYKAKRAGIRFVLQEERYTS